MNGYPSMHMWLLAALVWGAALYAVIAIVAVIVWRSRIAFAARHNAPARAGVHPAAPSGVPVSVLKPLCGDEPRLFENLATFCEQTHPCFELICGVSSPDDPAVAAVVRLQAAYPRHRIVLVIDPCLHGSNRKVSNLINLQRSARYDTIVIADSDVAVGRDYLERICAPLADPQVGVVTCLYRAKGIAGFWSWVGAQFINAWFVPSVRVAHLFGSTRFGFGATLAFRRTSLERAGGFERLRNTLADDYRLAAHVRELGLKTVLSPVIVETDVTEDTLAALWDRETRWLRTIRSVNRAGFSFLFVTITLPWMLCGAWLVVALGDGTYDGMYERTHDRLQVALAFALATGVSARIALHALTVAGRKAFWTGLALMPVRDLLLAGEWLGGLSGSTVRWRGVRLRVDKAPRPETRVPSGLTDVPGVVDGAVEGAVDGAARRGPASG